MNELKKELNWDIKQQPIFDGTEFIGTDLVKGHKSIRRDDNGLVLNVTNSTYNPMTTARFKEKVSAITGISDFKLVGFDEFNGGKIILAYLENNVKDLNIGGNRIQDYIVIGTSFDNSKPFFVGTTSVLLRCTNQFSSIAKLVKVRNTKNSEDRIQEAQKYLESYVVNRSKMFKKFDDFSKVIIDPRVKEEMVEYMLGITEQDKLDDNVATQKSNKKIILMDAVITETKALGDNLWGLFNGATYYTTHLVDQKHETFGNLFGTKASLNEKAFKFCEKKLLEV